MALIALVVAAGSLFSLGWLRRDLARIQEEVVELHEALMQLRSERHG